MAGSIDTSPPGLIADGTAANLASLVDQVTAAREDLQRAWHLFKYGPTTETEAPDQPDEVPASGDRIMYSAQTIHTEILFLRELAEDIRSRA